MELGNGYLMGTDPLANFAVITKFEPCGRNGFPFKTETFSIGTGEFRAWKKTGGLQHRTVRVADGTFDALINIGFHRTKCFATEITEGTEGKSPNSFFR
jgi:hypothetical protein